MSDKTIGRFCSKELASFARRHNQEDERLLFEGVCGRRFDDVVIRLTLADYCDPVVQSWIKREIFTRIASPVNGTVTITVVA